MSSNRRNKNIVGHYRLERTIGQGTFGKVKLAVHLPTNEYVAIKILEKSKIHGKDELERVEKEIKYLKLLNHPNIIQIYEIIENPKNFYIVMEYANSGELFTYIVKNTKLRESDASYFFSQIIHAIEEIHIHKICHRDIKPENLLLSNGTFLKLIDFGLSNEYNKFLSTPCGSPCYVSPEMIRGKKYNGLSIDLWACGIILYAMVCGYLPFDDKDTDILYSKILQCKVEFPPKEETPLSSNVKDLILKILIANPSKRIKLEQVKTHPFLFNGNAKYLNYFNKNEVFDKEEFIVDYMEKELNFSNSNNAIMNALRNNRHNNVTTTFKLIKKKIVEGRFNEGTIVNVAIESGIVNYRKNVIQRRRRKRKLNVTEDNIEKNEHREMLSGISNEIRKRNLEQGNIIIINNTNMISPRVKMNPIYHKLINSDLNSTGKKNNLIRKIDTSISNDKSKQHPSNRDEVESSKMIIHSIQKKKQISSLSPDAIDSIHIIKCNKERNKLYLKINEQLDNIKGQRANSDQKREEQMQSSRTRNMKIKTHIRNGSMSKTKSPINTTPNKNDKRNIKLKRVNNLLLKIEQHYKKSDLSPHTKIGRVENTSREKKNNIDTNENNQRKQNNTIMTTSNVVYSKKINRNSNRMNQNVFVIKRPKDLNNFVICSTQMKVEEIEKSIKEFCRQNGIINAIKENKSIILSTKNQSKIKIEIYKEESSTLLKIFHLSGEKDETKIYIKKLYIQLA